MDILLDYDIIILVYMGDDMGFLQKYMNARSGAFDAGAKEVARLPGNQSLEVRDSILGRGLDTLRNIFDPSARDYQEITRQRRMIAFLKL